MPDDLQAIVQRMVAAGEPEENIALVIQHSKAQAQAPVQEAAKPEERSVGGFMSNALSSGGKFLSDTVSAIPSLAKLATAGVLASGGGNPVQVGRIAAKMAPGVAKGALEGAKARYGGVEQIKNTLYTDPVGVLADASTVLGGTGLAAKLGGAEKVARLATAASDLTNPARMVGKVVQPITSGTANMIVRGTLRAPASVREDFGGAKGIADAVLKNRVYSEASAQRKLGQSVAEADQILVDAQAAGVGGVPRRNVAQAVIGEPAATAQLRTRLGVPDQRGDLMETAKGILRNNPKEIPLTEAQALKREAQQLAYEAGADNQSIKKAAEIAKAKALRSGIEARVPEVGPVNARSQELLGAQKAFQAAQDRPRSLTNTLSALGGIGGFFGGGPAGAIATPMLIKAMDSPRLGAMAGIGVDTIGRALSASPTFQSALLARLLGAQEDQP